MAVSWPARVCQKFKTNACVWLQHASKLALSTGNSQLYLKHARTILTPNSSIVQLHVQITVNEFITFFIYSFHCKWSTGKQLVLCTVQWISISTPESYNLSRLTEWSMHVKRVQLATTKISCSISGRSFVNVGPVSFHPT